MTGDNSLDPGLEERAARVLSPLSSPKIEVKRRRFEASPGMPLSEQPEDREQSRKIAIAVDLSEESAHAVRWAVDHYLRRDDEVIILHVRPTSVLYGADWGAADAAARDATQKLEEDFDTFTTTKSEELAAPLVTAGIRFTIVVVKDHDMKERLCLEVERHGVSACIMGSRGIGAEKRSRKARLGSVSDYCVHHCDCPVVVVRMPEDKEQKELGHGTVETDL